MNVGSLYVENKAVINSETRFFDVTDCLQGQGLVVGDDIVFCQHCPPETYNLEIEPHRSACKSCPEEGAFCEGYFLFYYLPSFFINEFFNLASGGRVFDEEGFSHVVENQTWFAFACAPKSVCLDGRLCAAEEENDSQQCQQGTSNCIVGRTGLLCSVCVGADQVPVTPNAGVACVKCAEPNWAMIVCMVALMAAFVLYLHATATGVGRRIQILFYFVQMTNLLVPKRFVYSALAVFKFEPTAATGAAGGICIAPLSPLQIVALRVATPFALLAFFAAALLLTRLATLCVARTRGERQRQLVPSIASMQVDDDDDSEHEFVDEDEDSRLLRLSVNRRGELDSDVPPITSGIPDTAQIPFWSL